LTQKLGVWAFTEHCKEEILQANENKEMLTPCSGHVGHMIASGVIDGRANDLFKRGGTASTFTEKEMEIISTMYKSKTATDVIQTFRENSITRYVNKDAVKRIINTLRKQDASTVKLAQSGSLLARLEQQRSI
jgi:hypothetical protein